MSKLSSKHLSKIGKCTPTASNPNSCPYIKPHEEIIFESESDGERAKPLPRVIGGIEHLPVYDEESDDDSLSGSHRLEKKPSILDDPRIQNVFDNALNNVMKRRR